MNIYKLGWMIVVGSLFLAFPATAQDRSQVQEQDIQGSRGYNEAKQLEGRWVREDGGYMLVLQDFKPDGSLKAFYYNPRQINVHEANWKFEDDRLILYVELRDVNYPGSNYSLMYRASNDSLWGIYYQAVLQQNIDVVFVRSR